MAKDIVTKAEILGGEIDVRANFGQTVKVTVSPDPYMGDTEVTPSDQTQVLQTKKKFVQDDITVYPAPTETLSATSNGQFTPSSGKVGFSQVTVEVNPDLRPLSVSENGTYEPDGFDGYSSVTADIEPALESLTVTENGLHLPESGVDGFDRVLVDIPVGLVLIDTIDVDGVNGVRTDIDMSWFDTYDYVMMVPDFTFSRLDWPYLVQDATTGGDYGSRVTSLGLHNNVILNPLQGGLWFCWFRESDTRPLLGVVVSYLYWYLYGSSNTMTGTIKIYGIKIPT